MVRFLSSLPVALPLFGVRAGGAVAVLIASLLVYKLETTETAGLFFVVFTMFQVSVVAARFGSDIYIVRNYHRVQTDGSLAVAQMLSSCIAIAFLFGGFLVPILVAAGLIFLKAWAVGAGHTALILLTLVLWVPVFAGFSVVYFIYQARHKVIIQIFGLNVLQPWLFVGFYLGFRVLGDETIIQSNALALAFAFSICIYAVISVLFMRKLGLRLDFWRAARSLTLKDLRNRCDCAVSTIAIQAVGWVPYLLSSAALGPKFAAVFNILQRFAMLTTFISIAINSIAAPKFAELAWRLDYLSIKAIFYKNTRVLASVSALFIGVAGAVTAGLAPPGTLVPACFVLLGYWFNCSTSASGYYFQAAGSIRVLNRALILVLLFVPGVTLLLVNQFGVIGAAISIALAVGGVNLILFPAAVLDLNCKASHGNGNE